jgi:hypothetical protein
LDPGVGFPLIFIGYVWSIAIVSLKPADEDLQLQLTRELARGRGISVLGEIVRP